MGLRMPHIMERTLQAPRHVGALSRAAREAARKPSNSRIRRCGRSVQKLVNRVMMGVWLIGACSPTPGFEINGRRTCDPSIEDPCSSPEFACMEMNNKVFECMRFYQPTDDDIEDDDITDDDITDDDIVADDDSDDDIVADDDSGDDDATDDDISDDDIDDDIEDDDISDDDIVTDDDSGDDDDITPECDDLIACTVDSINAVSGECEYVPQNSLCEDADLCDGIETCNPSAPGANVLNGCTDGIAVECSLVPGADPDCTEPACIPSTGECVTRNKPDNTFCDTGNFCTVGERCNGGLCSSGHARSCSDGVSCTDDSCEQNEDGTGECLNEIDNAFCDDLLPCNGVETCGPETLEDTPGFNPETGCLEGESIICEIESSLDAQCASSSCEESTGICISSFIEDGTSCEADGSPCTIDGCFNGMCTTESLLACELGADIGRTDLDSQCASVACEDPAGCVTRPSSEGSLCETDGNLCTADQCSDGICTVGEAITCDDATDQCNDGACNPETGECEKIPARDGAVCDNGTFCETGETCDNGKCLSTLQNVCQDDFSCTDNACRNLEDGNGECETIPRHGACDNGLVCDGTETCNPSGPAANVLTGCLAGTAPTCELPAEADAQCNVPVCREPDGCTFEPLENGTSCDDGLYCSVSDACIDGVCTAGIDRNCSDNIDCTADTCDEDGNSCNSEPINSICDDDLVCNGVETCVPSAFGANVLTGCLAGTPPVCTLPNGVEPQCNEPLCAEPGGCTYGALENDTPCDAGIGGTCTTETCQEGACAVSATGDCSAFTNACNYGTCNIETGECESVPARDGGVCDDSLFCNVGETCLNGACQVGDPRDCSDSFTCTLDSCNETDNECAATPVHSVCDNSLICDGAETCNPSAPGANVLTGCIDGTSPTCELPPEADSQCNEPLCAEPGGCTYEALPGSPTCEADSSLCTIDACESGDCTTASTVDCSPLTDQCNDGACDPATGDCDAIPARNAASCDDGLFCNIDETCLDGACQDGTALDCSDSIDCTDDSCIETGGGTGACESTTNDTNCDNGFTCDGDETCAPSVPGANVLTGCLAGTALTCELPPEADSQCNEPLCEEPGGCNYRALENNTICDDGLFCKVNEACTDGTCVIGIDRDCSDAKSCTADSCFENGDGTGECIEAPQDGECDNSLACDGLEACEPGDPGADLTSGCLEGTPINCQLSPTTDAQCNDPACIDPAGTCADAARINGTPCADASQCTEPDQCIDGACNGTEIDCSGFDGECVAGTCNESNGVCEAQNRPNGEICNDGLTCSSDDECQSGDCEAVATTCEDGFTCTTEGACSEPTGCPVATPSHAACDDTVACNGAETCNPAAPGADLTSGCLDGTPVPCPLGTDIGRSDLDPQCATVACEVPEGCTTSLDSNGTPCDDSDYCTSNDTCQNGTCTGGATPSESVNYSDVNPITGDEDCDGFINETANLGGLDVRCRPNAIVFRADTGNSYTCAGNEMRPLSSTYQQINDVTALASSVGTTVCVDTMVPPAHTWFAIFGYDADGNVIPNAQVTKGSGCIDAPPAHDGTKYLSASTISVDGRPIRFRFEPKP